MAKFCTLSNEKDMLYGNISLSDKSVFEYTSYIGCLPTRDTHDMVHPCYSSMLNKDEMITYYTELLVGRHK